MILVIAVSPCGSDALKGALMKSDMAFMDELSEVSGVKVLQTLLSQLCCLKRFSRTVCG